MEAEKYKKKKKNQDSWAFSYTATIESTEKDKSVKNDNLCWTDHTLNDPLYGEGWALDYVLWIRDLLW